MTSSAERAASLSPKERETLIMIWEESDEVTWRDTTNAVVDLCKRAAPDSDCLVVTQEGAKVADECSLYFWCPQCADWLHENGTVHGEGAHDNA